MSTGAERGWITESALAGGLAGPAEDFWHVGTGIAASGQENSGMGDDPWTPESRRRERLTAWRCKQECVVCVRKCPVRGAIGARN